MEIHHHGRRCDGYLMNRYYTVDSAAEFYGFAREHLRAARQAAARIERAHRDDDRQFWQIMQLMSFVSAIDCRRAAREARKEP